MEPTKEEEQTVEVLEESSSSGEENIQAKPPKEKKPRSEAQKKAFLKAKEALFKKQKEKSLVLKQKKEEIKEQAIKEAEERIVKKAVSIKKKILKKSAILDEISDDDEPVEEIREKIKAKRPTKERVVYLPAPEPRFYFV